MKLAIIGTQGIPNTYGGFETLTEYLVEHLSSELEITVFCSSADKNEKLKSYKGAKLKYIPITSHGAFGIIYDSISLLLSVFRYDRILILGFGSGFIIPFFRFYKKKFILNFGGLDWKRDKWSPFAQRVIKMAEKFLVKNCYTLISDNVGIQDYIKAEYNRDSTLIAYGGDQAKYQPISRELVTQFPFLKNEYAFTVTRIQSDNNIEMLILAFKNQNFMPLVIVGNWKSSMYGIELREKYQKEKNIFLLDAIYDREILDVLRANCKIYLHAHSAGGTNPSLCEAMYLELPILAYSSGYNEYTTANKALYFENEIDLRKLMQNIQTFDLKKMGEQLYIVASENYIWENIAKQYLKIIKS